MKRRGYTSSGSRPAEDPRRTVSLACARCDHTRTAPLTAEAMAYLPHHCGQPMLIKGAPPPPSIRPPSALL